VELVRRAGRPTCSARPEQDEVYLKTISDIRQWLPEPFFAARECPFSPSFLAAVFGRKID